MGILVGAHGAKASTGTSVTSDVATTQGSGSTLVVWCMYNSLQFTSLADNKGNGTFSTLLAEVDDNPGGYSLRVLYKENAAGGANHQFTLTAGTAVCSLFWQEVTGGLTASIVDKAITPVVKSASPYTSTTTGTLAQANELAIGGIFSNAGNNNASFVAGGSFASGDRIDQIIDGTQFWCGAICAKVVSATTALNTSWTESPGGTTRSLNAIVTLKEGSIVGRVMRPADGIGAGGMQHMTGGMQGRGQRRSSITVPSNYHAFGSRHANHGLRV